MVTNLWTFILVILLFVSETFAKPKHDSNSTNLSELEIAKKNAEDFEKLAALVKPSIVVIESVDRLGREGGRGTGFVVRSDGVIATNFHVIGEHRDFLIRFANGKSFRPTKILAIDRENDLAIIKIDTNNLPVLSLGNSKDLSPGQPVFAIGNPLGYSHSVTRGVISAIRELEFGDGRPLVQVAIPIEPGSSGSPTLDLNGNVICILAIKSGGAMGFGIPVNRLKDLINNPSPIPIKKWLTIGELDDSEWKSIMAGSWKQRAGVITASGLGNGFGGRMLCLSEQGILKAPYELEVEVLLDDESGAAGLAFHSDGGNKHYGFYPTNGSLRLTCFKGADVYSWTILETVDSPAYELEEWNRLKVKVDEDGNITCLINGKIVIKTNDKSLTEGKIGLCKFRSPTAKFRNFKQARKFPSSEISAKIRMEIKKISNFLQNNEELTEHDLQKLIRLGPKVSQALSDEVAALEKRASILNLISEEVRERQAINELAQSLAHEDENSVNLLRSALLIARIKNKNFDMDVYLNKAERLAQQIASHFPEKATDEQKLKILVQQLFIEMGYHGSTLDYNHPSNSFMNEVMDDREGLPITLSVLFIELGKRLDLPLSGLGLPGHFMAMYKENPDKKGSEILIDPFGGKIVSRKEASELTGIRLSELDLVPSSKKDIITRMLRNLIHVSEQNSNSDSRLLYIDAVLAIEPEDRYTRAMRAMLNYGNGNHARAIEDIDILISEDEKNPEIKPLREIKNRLLEIQSQK